MAQNGGDLAIIPRSESVVTLPEYRYLKGTKDFTGRPRDGFYLRGLGGVKGQPVSSAGEEQLLGNRDLEHPYYPYRGLVAVHEFAHGIQNLCFTSEDWTEWTGFYNAAREANVFPGSHMMHDLMEFFAVLTTVYFEVTSELGQSLNRESIISIVPQGKDMLAALEEIYGGAVLPEEFREPLDRLWDEVLAQSSHNLIQWEEYPTYNGDSVTFSGTLLGDAVLSRETLNEARQGRGYQNFDLYPAGAGGFQGRILPNGISWTLEYPGDTVATEYRMEGRTFTVKFPFPQALGNPSDYVVHVWGFQDESRTPIIAEYGDRLGYARIRVE